jgi:hypothetical protein
LCVGAAAFFARDMTERFLGSGYPQW